MTDYNRQQVIQSLYSKANEQYPELWGENVSSKPADITVLDIMLEWIEKQGLIRPGQNVIDLGSSIGISTILFDSRGYSSTGYEVSKTEFNRSIDMRHEAKKLGLTKSKRSPKFVNGSYFPQEYVDLRDQNNSIALGVEERFQDSWSEVFSDLEFIAGNLTPDDLRDFDIFYAYPSDRHYPALLEFFALYAPDDGVFIHALGAEMFPYMDILGEFRLEMVSMSAIKKIK